MKTIALSFTLLLCSTVYGDSLDTLLEAIRIIESNGNDRAVGDKGLAKGPFQIHPSYWKDACKYGKVSKDPNWSYSTAVWSQTKSAQVVRWYFLRFCPTAYRSNDMEVLARLHNGGLPKRRKGETPENAVRRKTCTLPYWNRVQKHLSKP